MLRFLSLSVYFGPRDSIQHYTTISSPKEGEEIVILPLQKTTLHKKATIVLFLITESMFKAITENFKSPYVTLTQGHRWNVLENIILIVFHVMIHCLKRSMFVG